MTWVTRVSRKMIVSGMVVMIDKRLFTVRKEMIMAGSPLEICEIGC